MNALKAWWGVRAGLIPGEEMPEYRRQWCYSSEDYQADGNARGAKYRDMERQAHEYASSLTAGGLNWVNVEYLWL